MSNYCGINPCPAGIPAEDPDKLQGPEVGEFVLYRPKVESKYVPSGPVRIVERSYVWGPHDHNFSNPDGTAGRRRYDWKVVDFGDSRLVVDDKDLYPIPEGYRVVTTYSLKEKRR